MRKQEPADAYVSRLLLFLLLFAFCARDALLAVDPQVALLGFCRLIGAFGGAADAVFNHAATARQFLSPASPTIMPWPPWHCILTLPAVMCRGSIC